MKNLVYVFAAVAVFAAGCSAPIKEDAAYGDSEYYSQTPEGMQEAGKPTPSSVQEEGAPSEVSAPAPAPAPAPAAPAVAAPVVAAPAAVAAAEPAKVSMSSHSAQGSLEIVSAVMTGPKVKIQANVGNGTSKFWKRKWGYGFRFKFSDPSGKVVSMTKKVTLVDRDIPEGKNEVVVFSLKMPAQVAATGGSLLVTLVTEGAEIAAVTVPLKVEAAAPAAPSAAQAKPAAPAVPAKPMPEPEPLPEAPGQ